MLTGSAVTQFTSANGHAMVPVGNAARKRKSAKTAFNNALELQELILQDARDPNLKPVTRAALARAFCELEETKRKVRMKPLPKAIDVSHKAKPKRPSGPAYEE